MIARLTLGSMVGGGAVVLGLALALLASESLLLALALTPAAVAGAIIILRPFVGLVLLVFLAQLDAFANLASQQLPVSAYKLLTVVTLLGYVVMSYRIPRDQRLGPRTPVLAFTALLGIWLFASFLFASHYQPALDHLVGMISVMLLFLMIVLMADSRERLLILVWTLIAAGFLSAVLVILDTVLGMRLVSTADAAATAEWGGYSRSAGGSDYNPTTAAHMLLSSTIIAIIIAFRPGRLRPLAVAAALVGLVALIMTLARSAVIAFAAVAAILVWNQRHHRFFPIALIAGLALFAMLLPLVPDIFWERMSTLSNIDIDRTLWRRISYNIVGIELVSERPVWGVGPGNFPLSYVDPEYRWLPGHQHIPRELHNSYLGTAAELGIVGLVCFLAVMLASLRSGIVAATSSDPALASIARAIAYSFGAWLIASIFMPNEDTKFMWILPALCVAASLVAAKPAGADREGKPTCAWP